MSMATNNTKQLLYKLVLTDGYLANRDAIEAEGLIENIVRFTVKHYCNGGTGIFVKFDSEASLQKAFKLTQWNVSTIDNLTLITFITNEVLGIRCWDVYFNEMIILPM